jgi:hypothetical protein
MRTCPEDQEHGQRKYDLLPELSNLEYIGQGSKHLDHLDFAASGLDFFHSGLGKAVSPNSQGFFQVTGTKDPDTVTYVFDNTGFHQEDGINYRAIVETVKFPHINFSVFVSEFIGKTAFRQSAVNRHLAAFKTGTDTAAGTGVLTLMAFAGRLAKSGAQTSAYTGALFLGARRW